MDDESCVFADPQQTPGTYYFHAVDPSDVSYEQKTKPQKIFAKKFLIWQALSEDGAVREAFGKGGSIHSEEYLESV
jgi:hypothetical protein